MPTLLDRFGGTLAPVALLAGFGAMIGRLLQVTGGAQVLADRLIVAFGKNARCGRLGWRRSCSAFRSSSMRALS